MTRSRILRCLSLFYLIHLLWNTEVLIGQQNKSMLEQIGTEINLIGGLETSLHDMAVRSPRTLEPKYVSK